MNELISIADVIVGKPGPATILEIELLNKKAIITSPIGEQEKGNVDYAIRNPKFRYIGNDFSKLQVLLEELLTVNNFNAHDKPRRQKNEIKIIVDNVVRLFDEKI